MRKIPNSLFAGELKFWIEASMEDGVYDAEFLTDGFLKFMHERGYEIFVGGDGIDRPELRQDRYGSEEYKQEFFNRALDALMEIPVEDEQLPPDGDDDYDGFAEDVRRPVWVADVSLLFRADNEGEAQQVVVDLLQKNSDILDWAYMEDDVQQPDGSIDQIYRSPYRIHPTPLSIRDGLVVSVRREQSILENDDVPYNNSQDAYDDMQDEISNQRTIINGLHERLATSRRLGTELREEVDKQHNIIHSLQDQLVESRNRHADHIASVISKQAGIWQKKVDDLTVRLNGSLHQSNTLTEKVESQARIISSLQKDINNRKEEVSSITSTLALANITIEQLDKYVAEKSERINDLEQTNAELRENERVDAATISVMREWGDEYQQRIAQLEQALETRDELPSKYMIAIRWVAYDGHYKEFVFPYGGNPPDEGIVTVDGLNTLFMSRGYSLSATMIETSQWETLRQQRTQPKV